MEVVCEKKEMVGGHQEDGHHQSESNLFVDEKERRQDGESGDDEENTLDPIVDQTKMTPVRLFYCLASVAKMDQMLMMFYLNPFLLDALAVKPSLAGALVLLKQLWDALTDPLVGHLSDYTRSKWGRRRPWIGLSLPFVFCFWIIFWTIISGLEDNQGGLFAYYLVVLLCTTTSITCTQMPFFALFQEIAPTYGIRTRLNGYAETVNMIGSSIAIVLWGILTVNFETPNGDIDYKKGYLISAVIVSPFIAFPRFLSSLTIKENGGLTQNPNETVTKDTSGKEIDVKDNSFSQIFRDFFVVGSAALKFTDFTLLVLCWSLANTALYLFTGNIVLYNKYYLNSESMEFLVTMMLQLGLVVSMPCWIFAVAKFGKKRVCFWGALLIVVLATGMFFIQENQFYLLIVTIPFLGAAAGSQYICIGAMQPDCCAAFMDKTALKNEGMLYSIFLLGGKVGGGIALAISSYILGLAGYEGSQGDESIEQSETTLLVMRIVLFIVPAGTMVVLLIALVFIKDYRKEYGTVRYETLE